ncbi:hypothetical protein [Pedobacter sp. MR2016-24]|uniref:hypothetical protein n=1 Tax=Pedobacter sp. MR2016-24 TaxID=2994466 RepID=UPI002247EC94|nr:hypothetical protein [Pedobacter sp. MR2016-24]MCX2482568.1 hypothetical protein [Pedobacter sp. MR2016-24]
METTIKLNVPEDLMNLCTIYNIRPQKVMDCFAKSVSSPTYYTDVNGKNRWATLFFLQLLDAKEDETETDIALEEHYLDCFNDTLAKYLKEYDDDGEKAREAGRNVIRQWQKAVIADRAKYIFDQL